MENVLFHSQPRFRIKTPSYDLSEFQKLESKILMLAQSCQVSHAIQASIKFFESTNAYNIDLKVTLALQKQLLNKLLKIGFLQSLKEQHKHGILLLMSIRDNILLLINDHPFKMEYLILVGNVLGSYYRKQGKYKRAIYHIDQAINFLPYTEKNYLFLLTYTDYAAVFLSLNLFQKALKFTKEALNYIIDKQNQAKADMIAPICYNNMAVCFYVLRDQENSKTAFIHTKDFFNDKNANIQKQIASNYHSLQNFGGHRPTNSYANSVSVMMNDGIHRLNTSQIMKKPNYETLALDIGNYEFLNIMNDEVIVMNEVKKEDIQANNTKKKISFTKIPQFDIGELENKGILTWDQNNDIEFHGEAFFQKLKDYEGNKSDVQKNHRVKSEAYFTSSEYTSSGKIFKKLGSKEEFDSKEKIIDLKKSHPKLKSDTFFDVYKEITQKAADIPTKTREKETNHSLHIENPHSNSKKQHLKMHKTYSERKIKQEPDIQQLIGSHKIPHSNENRNIEKFVNFDSEHVPKIKSDKNSYILNLSNLDQNKGNESSKKASFFNEKEYKVVPKSSDLRKRDILCNFDEKNIQHSFEIKNLKNSDLFRGHRSIKSNKMFNFQDIKTYEERETQISSSFFKKKSSLKPNNKSAPHEEIIDEKPIISHNYLNRKDLEKIKKCQRFLRRILHRVRKNLKRQHTILKKFVAKIQRNYKKHLFDLKKEHSRNSSKQQQRGIIYKKINDHYYKIYVSNDEKHIIYRFIKYPENIEENRISIDIASFYEVDIAISPILKTINIPSSFSSLYISSFILKKKLFEVINDIYYPNLQQSNSIKKESIDNTELDIERKEVTAAQDENKSFSLRAKWGFLITHNSLKKKIIYLQRKFRNRYKLLMQNMMANAMQSKIICKKIDRLENDIFIYIECFKSIEENVIISGKVYEYQNTYTLKKLLIKHEILSFLIEPLSSKNLWDLITYDIQNRMLHINEEIIYKMSVKHNQMNSLTRNFSIPVHIIIKVQKFIRRFLAIKCIKFTRNKKHEISRNFKVIQNEMGLIKVHIENIKNEEFLKIYAYIRKKNKGPLKFSKQIHEDDNIVNLQDFVSKLVKSLQIKRASNNEFYIHSNEPLFQKTNEIAIGLTSTYLKQKIKSYEFKDYYHEDLYIDMNKIAVDLISSAWRSYKLRITYMNLLLKCRKTEKKANILNFFNDNDMKKILEIFQKGVEDEEKKLQQDKTKQLEEEKTPLFQAFKDFGDDITFLIKIFYNYSHKTLIINCNPLNNQYKAKEFHLPINLLGLNDILNIENFKSIYPQKISNSLYIENDEIFHSFKNLQKSPTRQTIRDNELFNVNFALERNEENGKKIKNEGKLKELREEKVSIMKYEINRDSFDFIINIKFNEITGDILINAEIFLLGKPKNMKDIVLDWFSSNEYKEKRKIKQLLYESKRDFINAISVKENIQILNNIVIIKEMYDVVIEANKSQVLYYILKEKLKRRNAAVTLQKTWRKFQSKAMFSTNLNSELQLLFCQIKVLKNKYFMLKYFFNKKKKYVKVKCGEIHTSFNNHIFWIIEFHNFGKFDLKNLTQILKNSLLLEYIDDNLLLNTTNMNLKINEKNSLLLANEAYTDKTAKAINKADNKVSFKSTIYLYTKLIFYFKTFQKRKEYLKNKEIKNIRKKAPLFIKSLIFKKEGYYLLLNCFYKNEEQMVLLNFVNLNESKAINSRYYFIYSWKTYPNRIEINNLINSLKDNLYFQFIYGNVNAYLLNLEYNLIEINSTKKKRNATFGQSTKLMKFISAIMLIQRGFRKAKAKEMKKLKLESTRIKHEIYKNGKLNHSQLMKINQEYYRVQIYENNDMKIFITATSLYKKKHYKTSIEIDDLPMINTQGQGIEKFLLNYLKLDGNQLKVVIPEQLSNIKEDIEVIDIYKKDLEEIESHVMVKFEETISRTTNENLIKKKTYSSSIKKPTYNSQIIHQEEIDGNLFNVYYQKSVQNSNITTISNEKTMQIDVNVEDLLTLNPNLKLNEKNSLKKVAEVLTKSIKIDSKTDEFFIDAKNLNPDSLKMKKVEHVDKILEEFSPAANKFIQKKISNLSKFQNGIPIVIKAINEKRKVLLKKTKIINGKQFLVIVNYIERPLKKIGVVDQGNMEELLEDYEVMFEVKANCGIKESLQIELSLGELSFICQLQNFDSKKFMQKTNEYQLIANDFVDNIGIFNNKLKFEIITYLNAEKKLALNQLKKKLKKNGQEQIIFVNILSIKKFQNIVRNQQKHAKYDEFRRDIKSGRKLIAKRGFIYNNYELVLLLKEINTFDLELCVWDVKNFSVMSSIYLKKKSYERCLMVSELRNKILDIIRNYLIFTITYDTDNKPLLSLFFDEEKTLKFLKGEEKKYASMFFKQNLQKN